MTVCRLLLFLVFIILSTHGIIAQESEEQDQCVAASGWSYSSGRSYSSSSSSASAGGGGGGGGGGSAGSSASEICVLAKAPSQCIRAHPACSWCAQPEFSGSRCNTAFELVEKNCNSSSIHKVSSVWSSAKSGSSSSSGRFSIDYGEVRLRVGDVVQIPFIVSEPEVYPIDFYYLMDVSFSMADDLKNVKSLGSALVEKLEELTNQATGESSSGTVRLGFGKFVDKVQSPMVQMTPQWLKHPYRNDTDAPFLFKNVVKLTKNVSEFEYKLTTETVSGNLDPPEGALDAMLQVVMCKDHIGWRQNALRLLMIATESAFHYADDGAGFLSGIIKRNDGQCHMDVKGSYTEAENQDYPSIRQVVQAVQEKSITPIFAVKEVYADLYKRISEDYFKGSTSGVLGTDSSNVVALVEDAYKKIAGQQELVTDNPDGEVLCPFYSYAVGAGGADDASAAARGGNGISAILSGDFVAINGSGAAGGASGSAGAGGASASAGTGGAVVSGGGGGAGGASASAGTGGGGAVVSGGGGGAGGYTMVSVEDTQVIGLKSGSHVNYNLYLAANRGSCMVSDANPAGSCDVGTFDIKTRRYDEKLKIKTTVIGAFGCEKDAVVNSPACTSNGKYICGICECNAAWTGPRCNIPYIPIGCKDCSGRGECVNDRCICDPGYKHNVDKIYGSQCECNDCPKRAGLVCSNHGTAVTKGCACTCECLPGWTGHDCSCKETQETCVGVDGSICSGRGTCSCGRCNCNSTLGYGGPICDSCLVNCPTCANIQDCVQCTLYTTGPKNQTCAGDCKDSIRTVDKDSITPDNSKASGHEMCAALDASDNCKFYFKYRKDASGAMEIYAEEEKRCKPAYSLLIILWCILLVLLIGLLLLCCWRCCVYVIDKEEEKNYNLGNLAKATIPLLPVMGAGNVVEFIKAKYLVRQSAKLAVIPVRRNFFAGKSSIRWKTFPGSSKDDDYEVLNEGEEGTMTRKRHVERVNAKSGQSIEMEPLIRPTEGNGLAAAPPGASGGADAYGSAGGAAGGGYATVDETAYDWGSGELVFADNDEFSSIEIPLAHNFAGRETMFWVELYHQEKGVALGLKRTKVIVIKDEDAGVIGFPKPSCVFKENDQYAVVPVHRTIGMDGKVSCRFFTRDITAIDGKHYIGRSGTLEFEDGEVTKHIEIELIPDVIFDDTEKAFNIELEDPKGGASLDLSHCMITVLCNEECAVIQFSKTAYPFMENCGIAEIPVMRTRSTKGLCTVKWRTEDQTAFAGTDYEASEGTLTFPNSVTEGHIRVPIIDNNDYDENGRSFLVRLYDPSENTKLAQDVTTISIIEDDEPGVFEFAKNTIVLRKTGLGPLVAHLPMVRSLGTDGHVTIPWIIQAHDNTDLPTAVSAMSGSVDFEHGEITHALELVLPELPPAFDANLMFSFDVNLMQPTGGGKLGTKHRATVTVFDEEDTGYVSFAQPRFDAMAASGMATLLVSRKGNLDNAAFVMYETMDHTAISGTHYRGGTSSLVFEVNEAAKEVGIPIYNDPSAAGRPLTFNVALKSTPGGPKIGDYGNAEVAITCMEIAPMIPARSAPSGKCTVELLKRKYLVRRSAKTAKIPVHKSSTEGHCVVEWACVPKHGQSLGAQRRASMSSSSSEDEQLQPMGRIEIPDGADRENIDLDISEMDIVEAQVSLNLILLNVYWIDENNSDDVELGQKKAEVVILNDIDPGTLGFSKATYSFKSNDGIVSLPVHRLGGMDGDVTVEWFTRDDTAKANEDYLGEHGTLRFGNNEIMKNVEIKVLSGHFDEDEREKQFTIELEQATGGAKTGTRIATVKILGGEDQSVVQFSKSSYPVIGSSTSIKIPVLRTGDSQSEATVEWYTEDGTAKQGIDYKLCRDFVVFPTNATRAEVEIPLSGLTTEPRTFKVQLESIGMDNVKLGRNNSATIAIISSREPGTFEFSKPSFVFKTTAECGLVPVVRSNGTDGEVKLPWRIESPPGGEQSPFEGAVGYLTYDDGQVSASVEVGLEGVPSTSFVLVLLPPENAGKLGSATKATVSIIGEAEEPTIDLAAPSMFLKTAEVVRATVLRHGNTDEMTCVGWRTEDGTAENGKHFIGGAGNLVFEPDETSKDIMVPVLRPPVGDPANFKVHLTEVVGPGKLGDTPSMEITLEPMESGQYIADMQQSAAAPPETYVEFLRKRHHFSQSAGTALVPVHRSDTLGALSLRYETENISRKAAKRGLSPSTRRSGDSSSSDEEAIKQKRVSEEEGEVDWGSGIITFEDGESQTAVELILHREFSGRDSNFKISLIDPWEKVYFGIRETIITVLKDRDAGALGFAKPMYEFSCNDKQLVIPVHRSSGADGTISVPWFTRDGSAIGGTHYLPDDGNLVFRDGEVVQKIAVPMPQKPYIFVEDLVAFDIVLGEPTGGAVLDNNEAKVVLKNDIVPSTIGFGEPFQECAQSEGTVCVPVVRSEGLVGKVVVPWRATSAPGKPRSRYEGTNDTITFKDGEEQQNIELVLPKGLQPSEQDFFVLELDEPKTGRASIGDVNQCTVAVNNDITMGTFSLSSANYSFNQSESRGCVTVVRTDGTEGEVTLPWKIKSNSTVPTILHNKRGVVEFNPGQTTAKIEIPLPKDSENDEENYSLSLSPPGGRGKLGEPKQAEVVLVNDVESSIGFPQPLFETSGDANTLLLPVVREGPKGRPVTVCYQMNDGSAKDNQHYIGEKGSIDFDAGEDSKNILISILNDPTGDRVQFEVELHSIQGPGKMSGNATATVAIDNLAGPGIFIMASPDMDVDQSSGTACITVLRTRGRKGEVELPWFVEQIQTVKGSRKPSNYDSLEGKLHFDDGEGQKILEIPLESTPQDSDVTKFDAVLMTPTIGAGAALGDVTATTVTVNNDIDGGTLEMAADKVEVSGTDKDVAVPVVRTGAIENKCYVTWEAEDVTAVRGKHYKGGRGNLSFEPGEKSKKITIPILNDPSGEVTSFNICLGETKGGAKLGEKTKTEVVTQHVRENGEIGFEEPVVHFRQSQKTVTLTLTRKTGSTGIVVVPWTIQEAPEGSPYHGLKGQEKFKDGETESHIEISPPNAPQENEQENFKIVLGQPMGGAFLTGECECAVSVENDVPFGQVSFQDEVYEVDQSDGIITLPILRSKRIEGRLRVPWSTKTDTDASNYNDLTGVEIFEDGEKKSHIEIELSQGPSEVDTESFDVILNQPKSPEARLGDIQACKVVVRNDIEQPLVTFGRPTQEALQSESRTFITIKRLRHPSGRVIVPWKLVPEDPDSPYTGIVGETVLEDGETEGTAEVHLPQVPLDKPKDTVNIILEDPIGGKLADDAMCKLTVTNDVGEGIVEMKSPTRTCNSDDGRAQIMVVRKLFQDYPAEVRYVTEDEDACAGQHYEHTEGDLKFRPGEHERPIPVNLINDPTGETRRFKVKLVDVQGRDRLGDMNECRVTITNEATPPPPVPGFTATLTGPQTIETKWLPVQGTPVDGYKVSYWSKPGTSKTVKLGPDETEFTLEPLDSSTTYQVLVCAYNDVGDGPTSDKVIVNTDPETRLSYDSPIQFKTSMHIARFTITRTQTKFKSTFNCDIIKEKQKKLPRSYESSSESASSSSSDDGKESVVPTKTSVLTFEPGQSTLTVEIPLEQKMKKMSKIYFVKVYDPRKREKTLANVELHVINDTGVPGHVRTPFCASMTPKECMVTWEPPIGGGPVKGYEVVARADGLPDSVKNVSDGSTRVLFSDLQPSTKYFITVQPYNNVGKGKRSNAAETSTQDEMKVEFAERFYTFKMSDKVAVIPIKRHFAHGYATLKWHTQWSKTQEEAESSSSSEEEETGEPGDKAWASGAVTFADGQDTANVQIPLKQAQTQKKRSFFWLYILDPNRRKRLGAMKCGLVDDKARITAPKEASVDAIGPDSVMVTWNPENVSAQEYWISFKRAGSRDDASRRTVSPDAAQFIITDLKSESTYAIVVTAIGDGGKQASTEVMSCTTPGNVPGPPNRLVFQVLSPSSLQCSWGEPANPNGVITSYDVMYELLDKSKNDPPILVQIPDGHYRSLLIEELRENEPYKYSVRAKNQWGNGPFRHADMNIEHVGARPPSAIFLDAHDTTFIQQQQKVLEEEQREQEERKQREETRVQVSQRQFDPTEEVKTTQSTKTRVTRYIHREGQAEPEKETMEFEGRLSQEELAKMAEEGGRLEVQVISYNTTQRKQTGGATQSYQQTGPGGAMQSYQQTGPGGAMQSYQQTGPQEYTTQMESPEFTSDSKREVFHDVQEFTDVQKEKDGDADVTTITKTYKTTKTERQLDTRSGVRKVVYSPTQPK